MIPKICYLGDGTLNGAASYLAGVMLHHDAVLRAPRTGWFRVRSG
jgi:hypothetical protein